MLKIFNKFKKKTSKLTPANIVPVCNHKWKDFPWYIWTEYSGGYYQRGIIHLYEPYVCIHCKERKDIELWGQEILGPAEYFNEQVEFYKEKYHDKIKERPIVEDMINDMQLVDREYLAIAATLYPDKYKFDF